MHIYIQRYNTFSITELKDLYKKYLSANLPLFSCKINYNTSEFSDYVVNFAIPDKYTDNEIYIQPYSVEEKDYQKINEYWNYCIQNNLNSYDFEL